MQAWSGSSLLKVSLTWFQAYQNSEFQLLRLGRRYYLQAGTDAKSRPKIRYYSKQDLGDSASAFKPEWADARGHGSLDGNT